jgi:hypothetical protein
MTHSTTSAGSGRTGAGFLFFLGFCLVAAGVGFAAAPHYSWTVTKIARQVAALGLQNGVLVVGGLTLFGLGIVARGRGNPVSEAVEDDAPNEELHLLNEQVSAKFSQTRTALLQLSEGQRTLASQLQALHQKADERPAPVEAPQNNNQDALFRLAASLDKLNAHVDERIHSIDLQLRSGLESLAGELRRSRSEAAPAPNPAPPIPARREAIHGQPATTMAPEGAIDFYETMQKLDAIAGEAEAGPHGQQQSSFGSPDASSALDSLLPEEYR